jgi:hypothetical protein
LTFHLDHASKRLEATAICRGTNLDEPHAQLKPRVAEETHKVETGPTIVEVIKDLFSDIWDIGPLNICQHIQTYVRYVRGNLF